MFVPEKDDVTGTVARYVPHAKSKAGSVHFVSLTKYAVGRRTGNPKAGQTTHVEHRIAEHWCVQFANDQWSRGERLLHSRISTDVVSMPVRVQDHSRL